MAKLSAHGHEIGRQELLTHNEAFMSDGTLLENRGPGGWKVKGHFKPGADVTEKFLQSKTYQEQVLHDNPHFAAYRQELHNLTTISNRWMLHESVKANPEDPDGVWAECCDGLYNTVHASVDEIVHLCRLYLNYRQEQKYKKARE